MGDRAAEKMGDSRIITRNAIDEILKYYHFKPAEIPDGIDSIEQQLDYCMRAHGIMRRKVELSKGWYKDAFGPILAFTQEEGLPVALIPGKIYGYSYTDPKNGTRVKISAGTAAGLKTEAVCFYRPLPLKKLGIPDLLKYMKQSLTLSDGMMIIAATLALTAAGLLIPRIVFALTGPVLGSGRENALIGVAVSMICISLSTQLISGIKDLLLSRMETKTSLDVQAAMTMRLLSLPANFFKKYSPGELKSRAMSVNTLCSMMLKMVMNTGLTSFASLLYIGQIFSFAPALVIPSIIIVAVTVGFSVVSSLMQTGVDRKLMEHSAREAGMSYGIITGIRKIKLSGAENRVFAKWLDTYADVASLTYDPPAFLKLNNVISVAISLVSSIVLYYLASITGIGQSEYYAFTASYGMLMGAFMSLSSIALSAAHIRPVLEMAEPFLEAEPETAERKEIVTDISGGLEIEHVSFRYDESSPYILDNLSLKIRPGEYIAVVGRTGCGKSTLVRLLLGFEKPEKGAVFIDGHDIAGLDLPSMRGKIGTVMQDSALFRGDIYSNIVISAPELTLDDAWEAAETAGIADDIRAMPMGMHTVVSEGQGGVSGGQRQRLLIARAIAPKPKILIFDEATSALDNKTQRRVSDALDSMGCTRLVIAHRLSTIRHCDRILVLEDGHIVEDGNYDELIKKGGVFAGLVARQRIDQKG